MEKILNDWRSYVNEQTKGLSDLQKQRASERHQNQNLKMWFLN
jgi:hypothetical protein